jgi:HSP20 family protein
MASLQHSRRPQQPGIQRWDPSRDFADLQMQLNRLMEGTLAGALSPDSVWTPLADIEETEDEWIVEAEIPGVDRKDINVEVRDSEVAVTGEIKEKERKGLLRRRTRPVGRFEFRVVLPGEIDSDKVDASVDNGVLTLRIPKAEKARPRRIAVGEGHGHNGGTTGDGGGNGS